MKVLHLVVVALLVLAAVAMDDAGRPRRRSRRRSDLSVKPITWGGAKVVVVPKCDSRAYETTAEHANKCRGVRATPSIKAAALPVTMRPALKSSAPSTGLQSPQCTARKGACQSRSACTGTVVPGLCPGPADWTCCLPKGTTASIDACLKGFSGAKLASTAITWQQHYASRGVKYSQANRQFGFDVSYADCTSFGWSVMNAAGYGCLFNNARYTAAMKPLEIARGGYHQNPLTGDIAMWGGHFGIVVQTCSGGKVDMVAMGNSGCRRTGCITVQSLKAWGSGGWLGFWTPRAL